MHPQIRYEAGAGLKHRLFLPKILLILTILLSSCAADSSDTAKIAERQQNISRANYLAHITANFPERAVKFSLDYTYNRDGDDRAVVTAPEEISGIALSITGAAVELEFDGARLEMGKLNQNGLSPFSAIPSLLSVWTDGNFSETQSTRIFERDAVLVISRDSSDGVMLEYRTWFSKDEQIPLYAEIFSDGERVIQCEFERVEYN